MPGSLEASAEEKNKCSLGDLLRPWNRTGSRTQTLPFTVLGINTKNWKMEGGVLLQVSRLIRSILTHREVQN